MFEELGRTSEIGFPEGLNERRIDPPVVITCLPLTTQLIS